MVLAMIRDHGTGGIRPVRARSSPPLNTAKALPFPEQHTNQGHEMANLFARVCTLSLQHPPSRPPGQVTREIKHLCGSVRIHAGACTTVVACSNTASARETILADVGPRWEWYRSNEQRQGYRDVAWFEQNGVGLSSTIRFLLSLSGRSE